MSLPWVRIPLPPQDQKASFLRGLFACINYLTRAYIPPLTFVYSGKHERTCYHLRSYMVAYMNVYATTCARIWCHTRAFMLALMFVYGGIHERMCYHLRACNRDL